MIRPATPDDIEAIVALWLDASIRAHPFVPETYWRSNASAMRNRYLPSAETYVDDHEGEIAGFLSLVGDQLAALFVDPAHQACGIGSALLRDAKTRRATLNLSVYADNLQAMRFYGSRGFIPTGRRVDELTGAEEVTMQWTGTVSGPR